MQSQEKKYQNAPFPLGLCFHIPVLARTIRTTGETVSIPSHICRGAENISVIWEFRDVISNDHRKSVIFQQLWLLNLIERSN
jgi:hypothetical protein